MGLLCDMTFFGILNLPPQKRVKKAKTVVPDFDASFSFPDSIYLLAFFTPYHVYDTFLFSHFLLPTFFTSLFPPFLYT